MKVLLVQPPLTSHPSSVGLPEPPLGLAYLASFLEENGYKVAILDALALGMGKVEHQGELIRIGLADCDIRRYIEGFGPDIVGVSAPYSGLVTDSHNIAKLVKEIDSKILVVFGGAHASVVPEQVLQDVNVDVVVRGEGEITLLELVRALERGRGMFEIAGTTIRRENQFINNRPRPYIKEIDSLPLPARQLLPMHMYTSRPPFMRDYAIRPPRTTMITSRGCPRNCVFCAVRNVWGHTWRARSPASVVNEIEHLVSTYNMGEIAFMDDNLTLNRERMGDICDEILRRKLNIRWSTPNGVAIMTLDTELLRKMKASGCWKLNFGIEAAAPETQKFIGKIIDLKRSNEIIKCANDMGLWTHGSFVIGFPHESMDSIKQTINYALTSDLDIANFYVATPYPGSRLYEISRAENLLPDTTSYWLRFKPTWRTAFFTKEQLEQLIINAYSRFLISRMFKFLNPCRIKKKVRSLEDLKFIITLLRTGLGALINARLRNRILIHLKKS